MQLRKNIEVDGVMMLKFFRVMKSTANRLGMGPEADEFYWEKPVEVFLSQKHLNV